MTRRRRSKTIDFNTFLLLLAVVSCFLPALEEQYPAVARWTIGFGAAVNIVLRFYTFGPLPGMERRRLPTSTD